VPIILDMAADTRWVMTFTWH